MSKELTTTYNFNGFNVRVYGTIDNPLFVAKDICEAIGLSNVTMALQAVDEDDINQIEVTDSVGRKQLTKSVSESGMYTLILRSDKPEAKVFRKWVTSEVLPSIRKHGMYATDMTIDKFLDDPDFALKTMLRYKEERLLRIEAEKKAEESRKELEVAQPTLEFHKHLIADKVNMRISAFAKILTGDGISIGPKQLLDVMRNIGLMQKKGSEPTQKAVNDGYMDVEPLLRNKKFVYIPVLTPSGCQYVLSKLTNLSNIDEIL